MTRGDCEPGGALYQRPCPRTGCRYHLAPEQRKCRPGRACDRTQTCALDVADEGAHTLEEIGQLLGKTRERVRQIEVRALLVFGVRLGEVSE